jgi:hypothetical protein
MKARAADANPRSIRRVWIESRRPTGAPVERTGVRNEMPRTISVEKKAIPKIKSPRILTFFWCSR